MHPTELRIADLLRDEDLLPQVTAVADNLLDHHSDSIAPLIERWLREKEQLGEV